MSDAHHPLESWHQVRPGVWAVRVGDRQDYRIEQTAAGFRLQASSVRPPRGGPHPFWVGPGGHAAGWDLPENAPNFSDAQAAVDAAIMHFEMLSRWTA
ncbi:MAG: hypothetical protein ABIO70_28630 [Pseudomonadota bacterium]